jgi:hypothetical protein
MSKRICIININGQGGGIGAARARVCGVAAALKDVGDHTIVVPL